MAEESANIPSESNLWSEEHVRNLVVICLAALTISITISVIKFNSYIKFSLSTELLPVYHTAFSVALLIGMAGLYYHASRFYNDSFYLFIAIGWLLNLAYLLFLNSGLGHGATLDQDIHSVTLLIALLSDLPFYLAGCSVKGKQAEYKNLGLPLLTIILWAIVYFAPIDATLKTQAHTIIAILFATYVVYIVYLAIKSRLLDKDIENTENPDDIDTPRDVIKKPALHQKVLVYSFFTYSIVQLSFIVILFDGTRYLISHMLFAVLVVKTINAYGLTMTLREDYADLRARAERNEEKLKQEQKERSEFEEIGLLTASIEHELRTPLGVLRSKLNEMTKAYQQYEDVLEDIKFLQGQRERILNATRNIRILRAGHEFFNKKLTTVNLLDLARSAVKDLKREMDIENIYFKYEERLKAPLVIAHPQLIEQAIINILKNAVESINSYNPQGGEVLITVSRSKESKNFLVMDIKDNGGGFPEGSLHKLTQPDFSTKVSEKPNRGLGLFVCERIIRLHNGTLQFTNVEGGGAVVSICLQRAVTKKEIRRNKNNEEDDDSLDPQD